MNFIHHDVPQRSDAWLQARKGRLTGSYAKAVLAERKRGGTGELQIRIDLRRRLVCERLTNAPMPDDLPYLPKDMARGVEREPFGFAAYEARTGLVVKRSGFLEHTSLLAGCSLDGHVGPYAGLIELKCPKQTTHLEYVVSRTVPEEYAAQLVHNMWITGAQWADFVSFDDRFPDDKKLLIVRMERDEAVIADYDTKARAFLVDVERDLLALETMSDLRSVLQRAVA